MIAYLNVRSLNVNDKLSKISALASLHGFDVFAFSETWLNSSMANDSIEIPGYSSPLREDRVGMHGRGVAIYVKDHIAVKRCVDFEYSACMVRTHVGSIAIFTILSFPVEFVIAFSTNQQTRNRPFLNPCHCALTKLKVVAKSSQLLFF